MKIILDLVRVKFYLPNFLPLNNTNANWNCVIQKEKNKRKLNEVSRNIWNKLESSFLFK